MEPLNEMVRSARRAAGLTQAELAGRAGTSQAAISQYERGAKAPSARTLARLIEATGGRLAVRSAPAVRRPTASQLERAGRTLEQVLALAALLPTRHARLPVVRMPAGGPGSPTARSSTSRSQSSAGRPLAESAR